MSESAHEATDKRVQRSKELVLAETYKLLSEGGIGGVSIDEVSRRSGVSKTTIYRHWPSRSALLLEACSKIGTRPETPDTGSLRGDLTALAAHLADQLQSARWPAVLPSIIDAAERDPELAQLHATLHSGLMVPFFAIVERAKKRGELLPGARISDVIVSIVGPFFYRRWFSREPIDEKFVKSVVRIITGQKDLNKHLAPPLQVCDGQLHAPIFETNQARPREAAHGSRRLLYNPSLSLQVRSCLLKSLLNKSLFLEHKVSTFLLHPSTH